ncbi:MAG: hypothetical protein MIO92_15350 [Methanosarcinaceae archaeon]|nr:hypothetical protein [Methanosarcinaceae archaeon]
MAKYALTRYSTGIKDSTEEALEDLETVLQSVDTAKTIHAVGVVLTGRDRAQCVGYTLYDT